MYSLWIFSSSIISEKRWVSYKRPVSWKLFFFFSISQVNVNLKIKKERIKILISILLDRKLIFLNTEIIDCEQIISFSIIYKTNPNSIIIIKCIYISIIIIKLRMISFFTQIFLSFSAFNFLINKKCNKKKTNSACEMKIKIAQGYIGKKKQHNKTAAHTSMIGERENEKKSWNSQCILMG